MPKINLQLHATPSEMIEFLIDYIKLYKLYTVLIHFSNPFKAELCSEDEIKDKIKEFDNIKVICLSPRKPDLSKDRYLEFLNSNTDLFLYTIGKYKDNVLGESIITATTDDNEIYKIWKKIISKFKENTITGAWVVNPYSGAKAFYKNHRYTYQAQKLSVNGVRISPIAGWNYYILNHQLLDEYDLDSSGMLTGINIR